MQEKNPSEISGRQVQLCTNERLRFMNLALQVMSRHNLGNGSIQVENIDTRIHPDLPPNKVTVTLPNPKQLSIMNTFVSEAISFVEQNYKDADLSIVNPLIQKLLDEKAKALKGSKE